MKKKRYNSVQLPPIRISQRKSMDLVSFYQRILSPPEPWFVSRVE